MQGFVSLKHILLAYMTISVERYKLYTSNLKDMKLSLIRLHKLVDNCLHSTTLFDMIDALECGFCDLTSMLCCIWKLVTFLNMVLCRQVDRDCDFLEQERIMDYSMLVGLHFKETTSAGTVAPTRISLASAEDGRPGLSGVDTDNLSVDPSRYIVTNFILIEVSFGIYYR